MKVIKLLIIALAFTSLWGCGEEENVVGKYGCNGTPAQVAECEKKGDARREIPENKPASEGF